MIADFNSRVNMLKAHFGGLPIDVLYSLFKTYCMSMYGCQLINLSSRCIERFYTAWRKAIRSLFRLPSRTHSRLLPYVCDDHSVETQLARRFVKFYKAISCSSNAVVGACARLVLAGSGSAVSNSLSLITDLCTVDRDDVLFLSMSDIVSSFDVSDAVLGCAVRELNDMKTMFNCSLFSNDELNFLIYHLCTSVDDA